jgi:hypothetical protein
MSNFKLPTFTRDLRSRSEILGEATKGTYRTLMNLGGVETAGQIKERQTAETAAKDAKTAAENAAKLAAETKAKEAEQARKNNAKNIKNLVLNNPIINKINVIGRKPITEDQMKELNRILTTPETQLNGYTQFNADRFFDILYDVVVTKEQSTSLLQQAISISIQGHDQTGSNIDSIYYYLIAAGADFIFKSAIVNGITYQNIPAPFYATLKSDSAFVIKYLMTLVDKMDNTSTPTPNPTPTSTPTPNPYVNWNGQSLLYFAVCNKRYGIAQYLLANKQQFTKLKFDKNENGNCPDGNTIIEIVRKHQKALPPGVNKETLEAVIVSLGERVGWFAGGERRPNKKSTKKANKRSTKKSSKKANKKTRRA